MAIIGSSIHVDGDIRGDEDLLVEGEVNGTINLEHYRVTIGAAANVRADVFAESVYIDGFVEGDVYASEKLTLRKTGRVRGNLTAPRAVIEEGATFKGSIRTDSPDSSFAKRAKALDDVQSAVTEARPWSTS